MSRSQKLKIFVLFSVFFFAAAFLKVAFSNGGGGFGWYGIPSLIQINQSGNQTNCFYLQNNGNVTATNISIFVTGISSAWFNLTPDTIPTLNSGDNQSVCIFFKIPSDATVSDYPAAINASAYNSTDSSIIASGSSNFVIRVNQFVPPNTVNIQQAAQNSINNATNEIQLALNAGKNVTSAQQLLSTAKSFYNNGNYSSAKQYADYAYQEALHLLSIKCTSDSNCADSQFCYVATGTCYQKLSNGASCCYNGVCYSNYCQGGYCVNDFCSSSPSTNSTIQCTSDSNCSGDQFCYSGFCYYKIPLGQRCLQDNQCQSNICNYATCSTSAGTATCSYKTCLSDLNQTSSGGNQTVCPLSAAVCPDGTYAKCQPTFDSGTGTCNSCSLNCTGHQTTNNTFACGNGFCESGETANTCPSDCRIVSNTTCQEVQTSSGIYTSSCNSTLVCPLVPAGANDKCIYYGGVPKLYNSSGMCTYLTCVFPNVTPVSPPNPVIGLAVCPSNETIQNELNKCVALGLRGLVQFEGGCKVPICVQPEQSVCPLINQSVVEQVNVTCLSLNLVPGKVFDQNGCPILICTERNFCIRNASQEAISKCEQQGGEFVVKKDDNSCISFETCVLRGDERSSLVENQTGVPDSTTLLSIVTKLEELKANLLKAEDTANNLTTFYKARNDNSSQRFERVAAMLDNAISKINEIEDKIRTNINNFTTDDAIEIKHDVKYLKDVMMKDILYVMLSAKDDAMQIENGTSKDCGSDSMCFDRAYRVCQNVIYAPSSNITQPKIEIQNLTNGTCVIFVSMQMPNGTSVNMTCKSPNFALGITDPQKDVLPYCQGSLANLMKQFGGPAAATGQSFPPPEGGPGGCITIKQCAQYCINNYDACVVWSKDHPAYGTVPPISELQTIANS